MCYLKHFKEKKKKKRYLTTISIRAPICCIKEATMETLKNYYLLIDINYKGFYESSFDLTFCISEISYGEAILGIHQDTLLHPIFIEIGGGKSNLKISIYTSLGDSLLLLSLLHNHHHQLHNLFLGTP